MILALSKNFLYRLLFGFLLIAVALSLILISHEPGLRWLFFAGFAGLLALAMQELYRIIKGIALSRLGIAYSMLFLLFLFVGKFTWILPLSLFFLLLSFAPFFIGIKEPIKILSLTYFPIVYLALPLSTALLINEASSLWLIFTIAVSKMTDMAAYFGGKWLGKKPLAKSISPKKTVEGAIIGIAASVATAMLFPFYFSEFSYLECAILAVLISLISQYGDLAESILKRNAKIKDSGSLPGVGGVLDVLDSLVFVFPLVYIYLMMSEKL